MCSKWGPGGWWLHKSTDGPTEPFGSMTCAPSLKAPSSSPRRVQRSVWLQLAGLLALDPAAARPPLPITEVDVYQDMARFWVLAGKEESVLVSGGAGYVHDGFASVDVSYRRRGLPGLWDLLPTTIGAGAWMAPRGDSRVDASLGYTLVFGLFDGPYVLANAVAQWTPGDNSLALGFETGLGWELRCGLRWSMTADVRLDRLWSVGDVAMTTDVDPWGARITLGFRRYLDLEDAGFRRR